MASRRSRWNRRAPSGKPYAHPATVARLRVKVRALGAGTWAGQIAGLVSQPSVYLRPWRRAICVVALRWLTTLQAAMAHSAWETPAPIWRPTITALRARRELGICDFHQREVGIARLCGWLVKAIARVRPRLIPRVVGVSFRLSRSWWRWAFAAACLVLAASQPDHAGIQHAALAATTICEVQTGGDDTNNGGAFDPGQTAGMLTDGAATSANGAAPVFSSASYNFVAGDVGAWVYVASGTNWIAGWYKIASVAANNATLNGTIGQAVTAAAPFVPSTVVGCASTASPTGATWTIDYSQQAAAIYTYTDLASVGAGLAVSSVLKPFAKEQVGNTIVITGGTNFTAGRYVIASVAAGVATVLGAGNITTGAGVNGTGSQGGCFASPGLANSIRVAGCPVRMRKGTYTISTTSANISGGIVNDTVNGNGVIWEGYDTVRGDLPTDTANMPLLQVASSGVTAVTVFLSANGGTTGNSVWRSFVVDGQAKATIKGIGLSGRGLSVRLAALNCTNRGIESANGVDLFALATGCSTTSAAVVMVNPISTIAYANTTVGYLVGGSPGSIVFCVAYSNSGASSDGFQLGQVSSRCVNCSSYGNGRDGFRATANGVQFINCLAENSGGYGFTGDSARAGVLVAYCGGYNNTSGNVNATNITLPTLSFSTGSASFFTNAGGSNFSLNTTAGGGALARAAGTPGAFPLGLTTGYLDIGAAQHADPAAGGQSIAIFGG